MYNKGDIYVSPKNEKYTEKYNICLRILNCEIPQLQVYFDSN